MLTIEKRRLYLRALARYLNGRSLLDANREDVRKFLDGRDIRPQTSSLWCAHLHSFYEWAKDEDLTTEDPTLRIRRPKVDRTLPRPALPEQLRRVMVGASPQHQCWVRLAAYQGLRCQEIAGLRRDDVMDGSRELRVVFGKGGKERLLPLHPDTLKALEALPMPAKGRVFSRPRGGAYTPSALSREFSTFLGKDLKPHQLRHFFGSTFYGLGHDLRQTQEQMGHSSPTTTAVYTKVDTSAARPVIESISFDQPKETQ